MLPICLGEATKFSQYLLDSDKRYRVIAKLGQRTDTSDADGQIVQERPVNFTGRSSTRRWTPSAAISSRCRRCIRR